MTPNAPRLRNAHQSVASRSMARARLLLMLGGTAIVFGLLPGCVSTTDTPPEPPPPAPPNFTLSLAAAAPGISPGGTAEVDVAVNRITGYTGAVTIGPSVLSATEDFTADYVTVGPTETVGKLMLHAKASTPLGVETFHIYGAGPGTADEPLDIPILVSLPGSFGITIEGEGYSLYPHPISAGAVFSLIVDVNRNQFTQPVTLSANSIPGVTITFSPSPVTATQSTMSIAVAASAAGATDTITISASSPNAPTVTATTPIKIVAGSYTISAAPPAATINAGLTANATVTITRDAAWLASFNPTLFITGTAATGITIKPTFVDATSTQSVTTTDLPISVASSVPIGPYVISVTVNEGTGVSGVLPSRTTTFSIQVGPPASYAFSVQTAPLTVAPGTSQTDIVDINRTNFTGVVLVTATSDPGITIATNPQLATTANHDTLTVSVANGVSLGTHTVTVKGQTVSGLADVTTSFAVIVGLPAGGVPTGIVISPTSATKAVGGTQQFIAYLIDAQGNRTLPAAGWSIGILTDASNVAQVQTSSFDDVQRAQVATVQARGAGSTPVRAFYQQTSNGQSTFAAIATFTVTP